MFIRPFYLFPHFSEAPSQLPAIKWGLTWLTRSLTKVKVLLPCFINDQPLTLPCSSHSAGGLVPRNDRHRLPHPPRLRSHPGSGAFFFSLRKIFSSFPLADDQWGEKELEDGTWDVFGCSPSHDLFSCHLCCCWNILAKMAFENLWFFG